MLTSILFQARLQQSFSLVKYFSQATENLTRCGLPNSVINFLRMCNAMYPLRELMKCQRYTSTKSPQESLRWMVHEKFQQMALQARELQFSELHHFDSLEFRFLRIYPSCMDIFDERMTENNNFQNTQTEDRVLLALTTRQE